MKCKRAAAMATALAITVGGTVALAATQGSQEDPLITLSYLESVLKPQLEREVDQAVAANAAALAKDLDGAIAGYESRVNAALNGSASAAAFQPKTLAGGSSYTAAAGREFLVVSGSLTAVGELADTTAGTTVKSGGSLTAGHLYVTLSASSGCKASGGAEIMVR